MVKIAQYGSWESPLSAATVAAGAPKWVDLHGGRVWWAESRPTEGGRVALLREGDDGTPIEVLPPPWNVRNRVHEYGGRPWTVLDDGVVVFTNWDDQRLYATGPDGPRPISPEPERRESVCQVEWENPETLLALTDPDGWWNLFRIGLDGTVTNLAPGAEELGGPLWTLGKRWFAPLGGGRYAILRSGRLAVLDEHAGTVTDVPTDLTVWSADVAAHSDTDGGTVVATAGGPTREPAVVRLDLASGAVTRVSAARPGLPAEDYLPVPEERRFTGHSGQSVPAMVYPPRNPDFAAPPGSVPPFLVYVHGGPTEKFTGALRLDFAYFTSRGIGVVAVNYGGSTGYGRAFRETLNGEWGVVDVRDCALVAAALAAEGSADPARLAVRGGSAGGWTAAASMTSVDTYACGTIMYPILDLTGWTGDGGETHDFESRYVDGLVGTLPEHADRYAERSPINHIDRLAGPVLLLQGLEDQVCPPDQADRFVAGLDGSGIPHAYLTFAGEQHGFRKAETVRVALEAELSFYGQVFGFAPPGVPELELRT